jgi:1-acyl-sn-glycerol-3-phosphate acyltransferase
MPAPADAPPLIWRVVARGLLAGIGRLALRPRVSGAQRVPRGGAVLAFNHDSYLDVLLVAQLARRQVHFMVKDELLRVPLVGRLLRAGGVFPVRRGAADADALRRAVEICAGGGLVGMFPEGTLYRGPALGPLKSGAARVALRAGVPVVPVGIGGHDPPWRGRAFVRVGEPLAPEGDADALTERLALALRDLVAGAAG